MTVLAGIGFTAPWVLLGLLTLPILWLILRAVPPAPIRRLFPAVTLLLGLKDDESVSDRTPWWLLLLRMLAAAAIIIGLAGPVLNPSRDQAGSGPLLMVLDASWAGGTRWSATLDQIDAQLTEAGHLLLNYGEKILTLCQETCRAIEDLQNLQGGTLIVGASQTTGTYLLPRTIGLFRQYYPDVAVQLHVHSTRRTRMEETDRRSFPFRRPRRSIGNTTLTTAPK